MRVNKVQDAVTWPLKQDESLRDALLKDAYENEELPDGYYFKIDLVGAYFITTVEEF